MPSQRKLTEAEPLAPFGVPEKYRKKRERRAYAAGRILAEGQGWAAVAARFGYRGKDPADTARCSVGPNTDCRDAYFEGIRDGIVASETEGALQAGLTLLELMEPEIREYVCWKCGDLRRRPEAEGELCLRCDLEGHRCEGTYELHYVVRDERVRKASACSFVAHLDRRWARQGEDTEADAVRRVTTPLLPPGEETGDEDGEGVTDVP